LARLFAQVMGQGGAETLAPRRFEALVPVDLHAGEGGIGHAVGDAALAQCLADFQWPVTAADTCADETLGKAGIALQPLGGQPVEQGVERRVVELVTGEFAAQLDAAVFASSEEIEGSCAG